MKKVISMNLINVIQMKTQSFWLTALLVLLGVFSTVNTNAAEKLMAGTGKVNITPPNPRYPVHDSLYARTLILEAGASRIAFVSLDLVMYSNVPLAEKLKKQFGLQEVYFCPQHTHSGEAGPKEWLDAQITKALKQASSSMFEARISAGYRSFPQLSFNRLLLREDGRARESWVGDDHYRAVNPERIPHGPVDNSVGVIKLEDTKGNPKVILMNYACHPDVAWNNFEISADYVGYATKYTEEAFNNQVYCLFVQGGAGNQAPLFKDGGRTGRKNMVDWAGHADLVEGPDGKYYGVFLAIRPNEKGRVNIGRETFILPVDWSGEFPVFENGLIPMEPKLKTPKGVENKAGKDGYFPNGNLSLIHI